MEKAKLSGLAEAIDGAGFEVLSIREETVGQLMRNCTDVSSLFGLEGIGAVNELGRGRTGYVLVELAAKP
jgi:hypothetical protein